MKKGWLVVLSVLIFCAVAYAEVKVEVRGDNVHIDASGFPPKMQKAYALMMEKCSKCHSIERIVAAAQTGICPISKTSFSKETTKSVVTRMYLKPEANITKNDARIIIQFLNFLLDQKVTVVERK